MNIENEVQNIMEVKNPDGTHLGTVNMILLHVRTP